MSSVALDETTKSDKITLMMSIWTDSQKISPSAPLN